MHSINVLQSKWLWRPSSLYCGVVNCELWHRLCFNVLQTKGLEPAMLAGPSRLCLHCQIHSNVRANWQEAWKEIFFETLGGAMHAGGSTTNLTLSISEVIGIRSGLKPQQSPNQNILVAWQWKKIWALVSSSSWHNGQYGSPEDILANKHSAKENS